MESAASEGLVLCSLKKYLEVKTLNISIKFTA